MLGSYSFFKQEFQILYTILKTFQFDLAFSSIQCRGYFSCLDVFVGKHFYLYFF
jgi:hypothetical protein